MGKKKTSGKKLFKSKPMNTNKMSRFELGGQVALDCVTIALNREFGFGKDRILRLQKAYEKVYYEFYLACTDGEAFASVKLKSAINQIMQEESRFKERGGGNVK